MHQSPQEMAHEAIDDLLRWPYRETCRILIEGYQAGQKTIQAKLFLDNDLPIRMSFSGFKNQLEANDFVRHLKNYSQHTDIKVVQN